MRPHCELYNAGSHAGGATWVDSSSSKVCHQGMEQNRAWQQPAPVQPQPSKLDVYLSALGDPIAQAAAQAAAGAVDAQPVLPAEAASPALAVPAPHRAGIAHWLRLRAAHTDGMLSAYITLTTQQAGPEPEDNFAAAVAAYAEPAHRQLERYNVQFCTADDVIQCGFLGRGSFGEVRWGFWRGRHQVAIKTSKQDLGETMQEVTNRVLHEVKIMCQASQVPGVVNLIAVRMDDEQRPDAIIMEKCNASLCHRILYWDNSTPQPFADGMQPEPSWDVLQDLLWQAAGCLQDLHERRPHAIIHNDVRSPNFLLKLDPQPPSYRWELKLCDFGLSTEAEPSPTTSAPSAAAGPTAEASQVTNSHWLAPELLPFAQTYRVTGATDVYALGCTFDEMMTGPYCGELCVRQAKEVAEQQRWVQALRVSGQPMPDHLRTIVQRCFSHHAADRPTAGELAKKLQPCS